MAVFVPNGYTIAAAKVYTALFAAYLVVWYIVAKYLLWDDDPGIFLLIGMLVFELWIIQKAISKLPVADRSSSEAPLFFTTLTAAILVGWAAGMLAWSESVPAKLIEAAEKAAGNEPYCLEVVGGPVRSRRDLTGISRYSTILVSYLSVNRALLVTGEDKTRLFMKWSYRTEHFEILLPSAETGLHLGSSAHCQQALHFARNLN